jgi:hypothetical protein
MDREGYDRAFTAALIASASTMANLIPPSIMAVVYGATGDVSIGGLFSRAWSRGADRHRPHGVQLFLRSHRRDEKTLDADRSCDCRARLSAPARHSGDYHGRHSERMVHADGGGDGRRGLHPGRADSRTEPAAYKELPRDFMYAGLLYSLPLGAVAGASAFGWMVAYLRGPDIVAGYITSFAGNDGAMIMFLWWRSS